MSTHFNKPTNKAVKAILMRSNTSVALPYIRQILMAHFKEQTEALLLQADVSVTNIYIHLCLSL